MVQLSVFPQGEAEYDGVEVWIDGAPAKLYEARVSALPFNTWWRGSQRPLDQTELAGFISFTLDGSACAQIRVKPKRPVHEIALRPLSRKIVYKVSDDGEITFELNKPGQYALELDGWHNPVYFFANAARAPIPVDENTLHFGPGVHHPGRIELHNGSTLIVDEGAVVYCAIHAKDARNIHILGGGILDNSGFQRNVRGGREDEQDTTLVLERCVNVEVSGVILRDSTMFALMCFNCENVLIDNIKIVGNWRYNSDGIDLFNSREINVRNCFLRTFDDSIIIKGQDSYAWMNAENISVTGCVVWNDWAHALHFGADIRSDQCRNIVFSDCDIIFHNAVALSIQSSMDSDCHDILFENIRVEYRRDSLTPKMQPSDDIIYDLYDKHYLPQLINACVIDLTDDSSISDPSFSLKTPGPHIRKIHDVTYRNIQIDLPEGLGMPESEFSGYSQEYNVSDMHISGLYVNGEKIEAAEDANLKINEFANRITFE